MVDYINFQGPVRWSLILIFMFLKAGFIISIFMHMSWERLAFKFVILAPPIALCVFMILMGFEADYTFLTRIVFFGEGATLPIHH
jgi:cytochrome c oxidase subunit 4